MTADAAKGRREGVATGLRARVRPWPRSPVFYGVAVAVLAAVAGEWLGVSPPAAYGVCSACHGRDLADWIVNNVEGKHLFVAQAGTSWPLLTVVGIVIGSTVAARRNGEYAPLNLGGNLRLFALGALAMGAALFVGGCPTRLVVRTGYGDLAGAVALGGVAAGIVLATLSMRWVARR